MLVDEQLLSFTEATRTVLPKFNGRRAHPSTVYRWHRDGVQRADGQRVHLEAIKLGGRLLTSREAINRFGERLAAVAPAEDTPRITTARATAERERAIAEAEAELAKDGI